MTCFSAVVSWRPRPAAASCPRVCCQCPFWHSLRSLRHEPDQVSGVWRYCVVLVLVLVLVHGAGAGARCWYMAGQSNMDLALEYTFSKPELDKAVARGAYDHIRLLQYGSVDPLPPSLGSPQFAGSLFERASDWRGS